MVLKGDDEEGYVVDALFKDFEWIGHTNVIFKADDEPAVQAVVRVMRPAGSWPLRSSAASPADAGHSAGK